jgi:hypothetical protein
MDIRKGTYKGYHVVMTGHPWGSGHVWQYRITKEEMGDVAILSRQKRFSRLKATEDAIQDIENHLYEQEEKERIERTTISRLVSEYNCGVTLPYNSGRLPNSDSTSEGDSAGCSASDGPTSVYRSNGSTTEILY